MIAQSATAYFHNLSELLLNLQVTNQQGTAMPLDEGVNRATELILSARSASGKAILIGNGGSAAIASHMHCDLCNGVRMKSMIFTEPPLLTASSNDFGYDAAFERSMRLWAEQGDLVLAISSSGRSQNILRAVAVATKRDCKIITFSGFKNDNPLRGMGHINFYISSEEYGYVESAHSVLAHFLTDSAMMSVVDTNSEWTSSLDDLRAEGGR